MKIVNLSSLGDIPLSDVTRDALLRVGVKIDELEGLKTEAWGQSLLAIRAHANGVTGAPVCFSIEFDPASQVCNGCVWMPRCWPHDRRFLALRRDGRVPYPATVPAVLVDRAVEELIDKAPRRAPPKPPPGAKKRRPPPPPPPRRSK